MINQQLITPQILNQQTPFISNYSFINSFTLPPTNPSLGCTTIKEISRQLCLPLNPTIQKSTADYQFSYGNNQCNKAKTLTLDYFERKSDCGLSINSLGKCSKPIFEIVNDQYIMNLEHEGNLYEVFTNLKSSLHAKWEGINGKPAKKELHLEAIDGQYLVRFESEGKIYKISTDLKNSVRAELEDLHNLGADGKPIKGELHLKLSLENPENTIITLNFGDTKIIEECKGEPNRLFCEYFAIPPSHILPKHFGKFEWTRTSDQKNIDGSLKNQITFELTKPDSWFSIFSPIFSGNFEWNFNPKTQHVNGQAKIKTYGFSSDIEFQTSPTMTEYNFKHRNDDNITFRQLLNFFITHQKNPMGCDSIYGGFTSVAKMGIFENDKPKKHPLLDKHLKTLLNFFVESQIFSEACNKIENVIFKKSLTGIEMDFNSLICKNKQTIDLSIEEIMSGRKPINRDLMKLSASHVSEGVKNLFKGGFTIYDPSSLVPGPRNDNSPFRNQFEAGCKVNGEVSEKEKKFEGRCEYPTP